jgi:hypothetical protein
MTCLCAYSQGRPACWTDSTVLALSKHAKIGASKVAGCLIGQRTAMRTGLLGSIPFDSGLTSGPVAS